MPLYFFDIHDGIEVIDNEGTDLANDAAARSHAMVVASSYVNDPKILGTGGGAVVVDVRDKTAKRLTVRLVFTVTPE